MYSLFMRMFIFMRVQRFAVARFCSLHTLEPFWSTFARFVSRGTFGRVPFAVPLRLHSCFFLFAYCLCRTFAPKRFQGSFQTVFRAVLSGLFVRRVHLHRFARFARLYSLISGKFAVLRGRVGDPPPKERRCEAQQIGRAHVWTPVTN